MMVQAEPDIEVVGEAEDGAQAITITREHDPDVTAKWTSGCPALIIWKPPSSSWRPASPGPAS